MTIRHRHCGVALGALLYTTAAWAQPAPTAAQLAPGQTCTLLTQANADASAGTPNVRHDGSPAWHAAARHSERVQRAFRVLPSRR